MDEIRKESEPSLLIPLALMKTVRFAFFSLLSEGLCNRTIPGYRLGASSRSLTLLEVLPDDRSGFTLAYAVSGVVADGCLQLSKFSRRGLSTSSTHFDSFLQFRLRHFTS